MHYPNDTDASYNPKAVTASAGFYDAAYSVNKNRGIDYEAYAKQAAEHFHIKETIQDFAREYHLEKGWPG
jgi:hypothetical protein